MPNNDRYRKTPGPEHVRRGRLIRGARESAGLMAREVGHQLGVTGSLVSHWEAGSRRVPADRLADLARVLGCSVEWLKSGGTT